MVKGAKASGYPLEGRMEFQGLQISIENKAGSIRSGVDPNGNPWSVKMAYPYGYIRGTVGVDSDHLDCYVGPHRDATHAYIVDQVDPETGAFDEHKVLLGFDSELEAKTVYLRHYTTPKFFGGIREMDMDTFRGKVLYRKNWGRFVKAEQAEQPDPEDERQRARALLAELAGERVKLDHADARRKAACKQLQAHHQRAAQGLGAAVRDMRDSALTDAFLDHTREANRARALQDA